MLSDCGFNDLCFVTIIVAFVVYLKQEIRKEVMYEVVSDVLIANTDKRVEDKVKLTYVDQDTDEEIHNANIVSLKLWNQKGV